MMIVSVFYLVEDAEYMIMNCPSGGPSDLRESTTAEAHSTEEALSVTSTDRLQPGVSPALLPSRLHDVITLNESFIDMLSALNRILQLLSIWLVKEERFLFCMKAHLHTSEYYLSWYGPCLHNTHS